MLNDNRNTVSGVEITQEDIDRYVRIGDRLRSEAMAAAALSVARWCRRRLLFERDATRSAARSEIPSEAASAPPPAPSPQPSASPQGAVSAKLLHRFATSLTAIRSSGEVLQDTADLTDLDRARFVQIILSEEARLESLLSQLTRIGARGVRT